MESPRPQPPDQARFEPIKAAAAAFLQLADDVAEKTAEHWRMLGDGEPETYSDREQHLLDLAHDLGEAEKDLERIRRLIDDWRDRHGYSRTAR